MRIISGTARSRAIKVPKAVVRPTTDRTREALFNIIAAKIEGSRVLDLFAGSGSMGMEALSRGARSALFVDVNRVCVSGIEANLKSLQLTGGSVIQSDVMVYLKRYQGPVDLIFADPPYFKQLGDEDFVKRILESGDLCRSLAEDGLCVFEIDAGYQFGECPGLKLLDRRKYGGCSIAIFQKGEECVR